MVSDAAVTAVKILAGCATFIMVTSPLIAITRIVKTRSIGLVSVVPLVSLLANSHVWWMYGYLTERWFPVFSMFVLGEVLAVVYLSIYWRFTTERAYVLKVLAAVVCFLSIVTLYVILGALGLTGQSRHGVTLTLGFIADVVAVCLYGAPMEKILQVLRHKSAAFFNVPMVIAGLTNNICWFSYGLVTDNLFIIVPNILFILLGSFSLVLCVVYNPKTHPIACLEPLADSDDCVSIAIDLPTADTKVKAVSSPTYELISSPLRPIHVTVTRGQSDKSLELN